ncbi:MAG: hypothetical protein IPG04_15315 [Polyangiaceae bacterium]|nr:hypothetical protein [Polyangiaceae bacterium]
MLTADGLKRVFAAEVSRAVGEKKVHGTISYEAGKVTLSSGKAVGFTQATYPFAQDAGASPASRKPCRCPGATRSR